MHTYETFVFENPSDTLFSCYWVADLPTITKPTKPLSGGNRWLLLFCYPHVCCQAVWKGKASVSKDWSRCSGSLNRKALSLLVCDNYHGFIARGGWSLSARLSARGTSWFYRTPSNGSNTKSDRCPNEHSALPRMTKSPWKWKLHPRHIVSAWLSQVQPCCLSLRSKG